MAVTAIKLLPQIHEQNLNTLDQQKLAEQFSGSSSLACWLVLETTGSPEKALEILEEGRGSILGGLIDNKLSTSTLRASDPDLCRIFESLRLEINSTAFAEEQGYAQHRGDAKRELESCIAVIQGKAGFESFMRPLNPTQMMECARNGVIFVINVSELRSDAIIVLSTSIKAIPLELNPWVSGIPTMSVSTVA